MTPRPLWSRCSWLRAARPWNGAKKTGAARGGAIPEAAETDLRATGHDHHAGVCAHRVESRVERELGGNGTAGAHPSAP